MSEKKKPTFILGVGAQKAGTSWLHAYLSKLPEVDMGFMKEYHVFDQKFVADSKPRRIKRITNWLESFFPKTNNQKRSRFRRNETHYFEYFQSLVQNSGSVRITGDISPSYAGLPASELARIKRKLESAGFDVKVVFLMRDPVARCISANRMYTRLNLKANPDQPDLEGKLLENKYREPRYTLRTRYDLTIRNIEQVFASEDIFYGFYEDLINSASVARICDFFELPFREADYEYIVNGAKVKNEIPAELRAQIREYYSPVYKFVADKFGQDTVDRLWLKTRS